MNILSFVIIAVLFFLLGIFIGVRLASWFFAKRAIDVRARLNPHEQALVDAAFQIMNRANESIPQQSTTPD
jgi:hypothetical protein